MHANPSSLILPDDITKIGAGVFDSCHSLVEVKLPDSVESIGRMAFSYSGLAVINFPSSLTSIGEYAFTGSKIVSADLSGTSLNSIGKNAFAHCYQLTAVDLSGTSITSIEELTFYGCSSLTTIKLPDTLTTIGSCAFYNCENLSIEIPTSVSTIYSNMFGSNTDNVTIIYNGKSYTYAEFDDFKTDFVNYRAGNTVI
ncbi:leucine-rich repeat domain-containing protein [bacterium]|nr:leucine-rich repeat domain-containing protein [bacterium]